MTAEVPLVFDYEEMLSFLLETAWEEGLTTEQIETAAGRLGRSHFPALVADLNREDVLEAETAAVVVPAAWSAAEFPQGHLDEDEWARLFALAGYTENGKPARRPSQPLSLWRGAAEDHRAGWAWTEDRELAQWFADRFSAFSPAAVWTAAVEPHRLLARITNSRPGESEYVVDTRGLLIERA